MQRWLLVFGLCTGLFALDRALAQEPDLIALDAQLEALKQQPDAEVATALLGQAREALRRAATLTQAGEHDAAKRAQDIAQAALAAASHTVAHHQAKQELAAVQRRKELAVAAAAAARNALQHARQQTRAQQVPAQEANSAP